MSPRLSCHRSLRHLGAVLVLAALVCSSPLSRAQPVPTVINYQGRLTDNSPQRLPLDGDVSVEFRIFPDADGDTAAWSEVWPSVAIRRGIFSVLLGSNGSPLPVGLFAGGGERYLEVIVEGEVLAPRQTVGAVSYALATEPPPGPGGPTGPRGAVGPLGDAGATGNGGPAGPIGAAGSDGDAGPTGSDGNAGVAGPAGATGPPGVVGPPATIDETTPSVARGDLLVETGDGLAALPAGGPGQVLIADSAEALGLRWGPLPTEAAPVAVVATGQTRCFSFNQIIPCAGTGQNGEFPDGIPLPRPRFVDNSDGTVRDSLTGLIWTKAADCLGRQTWGAALADAQSLAAGSCGLADGSVAGDWRLPNAREMWSLLDYEYTDPALSNAEGTAGWLEGDPFTNVKSTFYWTSTSFKVGPHVKYCVNMLFGELRRCTNAVNSPNWGMAVRDEQ